MKIQFEGVIISHKSKKDRQHNLQKRKDKRINDDQPHRKLKEEQHKSHKKEQEMNSGTPEGLVVRSPLREVVVLPLLQTL